MTVQTAFPSPAWAVILHLPGFRAVTTPFFTLATLGLELFQVTSPLQLVGEVSACRMVMVPTSNVTLERSSRTEDRATAPQVTAQVAFCLSALAVMVHVPGATQVTSPSETVATSGSLDVHSTVPAQVLGVTVGVRAAYWLPFKYSSLLLS